MCDALFDSASGAGNFMRENGASLYGVIDAVAPHADYTAEGVGGTPPRGLSTRDSLLIPLDERAGRYDICITNPPFNGDAGETKAEGSTLKTKKTELLFAEHCLSSLRPGGRGCVLAPGGVLFGSGKAHLELRRRLIEENNLRAVVHVPAGAFKPYAGSATSIILFTAGAPVTERVWFDEITALGYTLDNRRRPTAQDDVPAVLDRWRGRHGHDGARTGAGFFVPVEELRENDYILQMGRYREIVMEEPSAAKSVEELLLDIVCIDLEVRNHMQGLASMLGMSYEELTKKALARGLPKD